MTAFDFIPEWDSAPSRVNANAFFPVSISATVREATFSDTLAGILDADPDHSYEEFKDSFKTLHVIDDEELAEEIWEAFILAYSTTSQRGSRASSAEANRYFIPFHRRVAELIEIDEARRWHRLYWLLLTTKDGYLRLDTHEKLLNCLFKITESNLVEELAVRALDELDGDGYADEPKELLNDDLPTIYPLLDECGEAFSEDIEAWTRVFDKESSSRWMRGLRDIINLHYMLYILQVAINLQEEYANIRQGEPYDYTFELKPIHFGLKTEQASQSREFVRAWNDENLPRALYDSWGRLSVMTELVDLGLSDDTECKPRPYTLTDALNEFSDELKEQALENLISKFPKHQRPDPAPSLPETALAFSNVTRRYYENQGQTARSQTAYSAGQNSLYYLGRGSGNERHFIERRKRVGTILRFDRGSLALLARVFAEAKDQTRIDDFWTYLRARGIRLDERSRTEAIKQLEGMGLLQRQSDSGEAMYVTTF